MEKWLTKDWTVGQLNALVKKIGEKNARNILADKAEFQVIEPENPSLFSSLESVVLKAVPEHRTEDCFQNKEVQYWRDSDLDTWTPQKRKGHKGGEYLFNVLNHHVSFREMALEILGVVGEDTSNEELQKLLIERGHCVEMKQIENLIEEGEIAKDGNISFFFVDNGDNTLSVVRAGWGSACGEWYVRIYGFGNYARWNPGDRILSHNLES